jgi:predicted small lipoprotein YifL
MRRVSVLLITVFVVLSFAGCGSKTPVESNSVASNKEETVSEEASSDSNDGGINLDKLNDAVDNINNLDLTGNGSSDNTSTTEATSDSSSASTSGNVTKYSYTDVVKSGNDITITPNGGMNGSTVLYSDKNLNGLLDYIDSKVLEKGRTINRQLFYDILATMIVDSELNPNFYKNEDFIMMALAIANNFHDTDVVIKQCHLDANNASEYRYELTAYGKDDIWVVDYGKKTIFFNDGKTEYHSDMFKNEYLAVWLMSIEEYYGVSSVS